MFKDRRLVILGPGGSCKGGGEAPPTFWKDLRAPRGSPDPQNDRFPILNKNENSLPKCSHVWLLEHTMPSSSSGIHLASLISPPPFANSSIPNHTAVCDIHARQNPMNSYGLELWMSRHHLNLYGSVTSGTTPYKIIDLLLWACVLQTPV